MPGQGCYHWLLNMTKSRQQPRRSETMSTTRLPAGRVYPDIQGLKKPSRLIPIRPCLRDSGRGPSAPDPEFNQQSVAPFRGRDEGMKGYEISILASILDSQVIWVISCSAWHLMRLRLFQIPTPWIRHRITSGQYDSTMISMMAQ